jgi:hypothetical protein
MEDIVVAKARVHIQFPQSTMDTQIGIQMNQMIGIVTKIMAIFGTMELGMTMPLITEQFRDM